MSAALLIKNARIIDPASDFDHVASMLVENGRISGISTDSETGTPEGAETVDARNMLLAPGLVDLRVFTGEPGHEYRETLHSAARAAVAGGITSFVCMPDTEPVTDDGAVVDFIIGRARENACMNILPAAAISKGLKGQEITEFGLLKDAGAVCFSEGRKSIQSAAVLRTALVYAKNFDMPVMHHPCDNDLKGNGVMNKGLFATTLGLGAIAPEVETIPLGRDLMLARATGARYHAAQISCARSVKILEMEKQGHSNISAGVSINNLTLNELDVGQYRTFFKLDPPLRSEEDRQALIAGLNSGAIDTIHSGHDPQDVEVKRRPFAEAADGAIGLETLFCAAMRLVHGGDVELKTVLRAMTWRPARILGLQAGTLAPGAMADFFIADLEHPWVNSEETIISRSKNTPFEGARFLGRVMETYVAGKRVFRHEEGS